EHVFRFAKLLEVPLRNLCDDVIDRRLKRCWSFAGDVVGNLVERVTDGELCRDLRDWETGRFRSERGGTRHARIHLDDANFTILRIDAKLNIRTTSLHADFS